MFTTVIRLRMAAGAAVLGAVGSASLAGQADATASSGSSAPLTVIATAPAIAAPDRAVPVTVAVTNSEDQLLCTGFTVSVTWWRADGRRHSASRGVSNRLGTASTTLRIPGSARHGMVRYFASASQQCGLLAPTTKYEGRWPASGSAAVAVV